MAPPKRKSGGRVTPKGTRPGDRVTISSTSPTSARDSASSDEAERGSSTSTSRGPRRASDSSSRYTPPIPAEMKSSPRWVPILMLVLLGLGGAMIMVRYLVFDSNWPTLVGLVFILGGLYTATKWR